MALTFVANRFSFVSYPAYYYGTGYFCSEKLKP